MIKYSNKFNTALMNDNRRFLVELDVTLSGDQPRLKLYNEDIWENTFSLEDATSEPNKFTVGCAVTTKFSVTINNIYEKFSPYIFDKAKITVRVGLEIEEGITEMRTVGMFLIDECSYNGSTIDITALDNMSKLDKLATEVLDLSVTWNYTVAELVREICLGCGVVADNSTISALRFANTKIPANFISDSTTCAQIIAYVAQINCTYAKVNTDGYLYFAWYNTEILNEGLDGGTFKFDGRTENGEPEAIADGGTFSPTYIQYVDEDGNLQERYSDGYEYDAMEHGASAEYHIIADLKSFSAGMDAVIITGVRVTDKPVQIAEQSGTTTTEIPEETIFRGNEGYVVDIRENPLIQHGMASAVCSFLESKLIGFTFRNLNATILPDPSIEAGDVALVVDRKGMIYKCFISTRKFGIGGTSSVACDAETPKKNSQVVYSAQTEAYLKSKENMQKEMSARELATQAFNVALANANGLYKYVEDVSGGGSIFYLIDKPVKDKADVRIDDVNIGNDINGDPVIVKRTIFDNVGATVVWMMSDKGMALSIDGGKTYPYGINSLGDALLNTIYAVGVDADFINAGTISVGKQSGSKGAGAIKVYEPKLSDLKGINLNKPEQDALIYKYPSPHTFTSSNERYIQNEYCDFSKIPMDFFPKGKYIILSFELKADAITENSEVHASIKYRQNNSNYSKTSPSLGLLNANGNWYRYSYPILLTDIDIGKIEYFRFMGLSFVPTVSSQATVSELQIRNIMLEVSDTQSASTYARPYVLTKSYNTLFQDILIGSWDKNGIDVKKGSISGSVIKNGDPKTSDKANILNANGITTFTNNIDLNTSEKGSVKTVLEAEMFKVYRQTNTYGEKTPQNWSERGSFNLYEHYYPNGFPGPWYPCLSIESENMPLLINTQDIYMGGNGKSTHRNPVKGFGFTGEIKVCVSNESESSTDHYRTFAFNNGILVDNGEEINKYAFNVIDHGFSG